MIREITQRSLRHLVCAAAVAVTACSLTAAHAAQPVAPAPIRLLPVVPPEPEQVRAAIAELKSACAQWLPVLEPAGVASPAPAPAGSDDAICSFVRDPEGAGLKSGMVGAFVTIVLLIVGGFVLGAASGAFRLGWRAFDRVVGHRRTIHAGDSDVA